MQNVTAHRRSIADPAVRRKVAQLRRSWASLSKLERGDHLRLLSAAGCSTRGLAAALGISATTVRRFLELASLSEHERQSVVKGASAKQVLAARADGRRRSRIAERLRTEKETGEFSDELAEVLIAFAKDERFTRDEIPHFLNAIARHVQSLDALNASRQRVSKRLNVKAQLKLLRPKRPSSDHALEQSAEWFAHLIRAKYPERAIWERALDKAAKRERELDRVPSRSLQNFRFGEIRFIEIPSRRISGPAREVMKRQGRKRTK